MSADHKMALVHQNRTLSLVDDDHNIWTPRDASLLTIIIIDTVVTLICGIVITACVMWSMNKRARRREERDKLSNILQVNYWQNEEQISKVVQILTKMNQVIIFRDVTEMHVFAYKYRQEGGIYGPKEYDRNNSKLKPLDPLPGTVTMGTARKIERLFEMLTLQLPCQGSCPLNVARTFGSTVYTLAHNTSLLWGNHKGRLIRNIVQYFAGRSAAERFDGSLIGDEDLETLVLARVPYISQLYLNDDHFVLHDVEITSDLKVDLKNKIRYVDTVLAKKSKSLQNKEKNITEAYYTARELCIKNSFIQNKHNLPDIVAKVGEPSKLGECVVYLRHLLRVMCINSNMKKVENDDKFFQFLMQLHESLYTWTDTSTMVEILERIRSNIFCYLRGLTMEQMLLDKEFTKAKLEHLEKELYRHLNYLTLRQVQQEKMRRHGPLRDHDPKLRTAGSDSSIYTMALSTSSFMMHRQTSTEHPETGHSRHQNLDLLHQQHSLDQSSIVSGSSMYATAMSVSSGNELTRQSPPPSHSPPEACSPPRASSPIFGDRQKSQSPSTPVDSGEYYETAV